MSESKSEADSRILEQAKIDDNNISKINVRHTSSTHPVQCSCETCLRLRFTNNANEEARDKIEHDLYMGNADE